MKWIKMPKELKNEYVRAVRIDQSPVAYEVYDLKSEICLGTCEVWYKKKGSKKIPVLKPNAYLAMDSSFPKILEVANRLICNE